jgi:hypothetical protein
VGDEVVIDGLTLARDVSPGAWVVKQANGPWLEVGSLLPTTFAAYARIFHPAYRLVENRHEAGPDARGVLSVDGTMRWYKEVSWAEIADANARVSHPAMQWISITDSASGLYGGGSQPGMWDQSPDMGSLPAGAATHLAAILERHTGASGRCWFAVWAGFGNLAFLDLRPKPTELAMPNRELVLFSGPLRAAGTSFAEPPWRQSASLWWPEDRAWCVATDVDLMTTYVGGSSECIDSVVASDDLEALPISVGQGTTADTDTLNQFPEDESD